jgi:hypothetical protein
MTYEDFNHQLKKARLTISEFADLVGMKRNSVSNYSKPGSVPSHLGVIAVLLALLAEHNVDPREALSSVAIDHKKPRGAGIGKFGGNKQLILFENSSVGNGKAGPAVLAPNDVHDGTQGGRKA